MSTMEEKRGTLTRVQEKFVEEYLKDPSDGGLAYLRANPKLSNKKSASVSASKLLKMPKVQEALKSKANEFIGVLEARIVQNVEFWLEMRDGTSPGMNKGPMVVQKDLLNMIPEKDPLYKKISSMKTYIVPDSRVADRMKASEYLGKYMQMFIDKKEVSVEAQVQIVDDIK